MKKILLVFGTRPEAIKMAPLIKELQKHPDRFDTKVCVTAQHREMLDQVLHLFEIIPDYDLNIMQQGQDLYDVTSRVILGMREALKDAQPDLVLVHGDTTTSTAAALAAFYQQIPVGHVEAGLRTNNIYSPWPEEMNRQITGRIASYHFSPTPLSKQNLHAEGVNCDNIYVTGNTVIDALYWVSKKMNGNSSFEKKITEQLHVLGLNKEKVNSWQSLTGNLEKDTERSTPSTRRMILITGHRRENFGQGFLRICEAIKELATRYPEVDFVYPMHLNPNVRKAIDAVFGSSNLAGRKEGALENTFFIEPLDYLPFVYLMSRSYLVLTDSGGIQEEAPGLGKPVLVMRDTTERPEALKAGTVKLVGTNFEKIVAEVSMLLDSSSYYSSMSQAVNPYGDGFACRRIIEALI